MIKILHGQNSGTPVMFHLVRWSLFMLLLTPLVFWNSFFYGFISTKMIWFFAISESTLLFFLWFLYKYPIWKPKLSWPVAVFFVYVGIIILTSVFGVYPMYSFFGDFERNVNVTVWLHLSVILIMFISVFRTKQSWVQLSLISTIVGLIVSAVHLFFPLFGSGSTLGNSSFFGSYLIFEFFFALFLFFHGIQFRTRVFGIISFFFFVLTLFLTDARAAMISFLGGSILFFAFVLFVHAKQGWRRIMGLSVLIILLLSFALSTILILKPGTFLHKLVEANIGGSRFVVWNIAEQAIKDHPWFGWGTENFKFAFLEHYNPCFGNVFCGGNTLFDSAHNKILDVWVESGFFGLIAYLCIFIVAMFCIGKAYKQKNIDVKTAALFIAVLAAYFVQNLTVFDSLISLLFFVGLYGFGINAASTDFLKEEKFVESESGIFSAVSIFYTLFFPFLLYLFVIQPLRGGIAVKEAVTTLNTAVRFPAYERALSISSVGRDIRRDYLALQTANALWTFDPVKDAEKIKKIKPYFKKEDALVEQSLKATLAQSPNDIRAYMYLSRILQAEGRLFQDSRFKDAEDLLKEAVKNNPKMALFFWIQSSLQLEQHQKEEAKISMQTAIKLSPDSLRSEWNTLIFAKYIGDDELLKQSFMNLVKNFPTLKTKAEEVLKWNTEEKRYTILSGFYLE